MHAVKPCIAQSVVASPGPGTVPSPGRNGAIDGTKTFGSWMNDGSPTPKAPGPPPGGPLRVHTGPAVSPAPAVSPEPAVSTEIVNVITQLRRDERRLDRTLRRALSGQDFNTPQLIALQSLAFRYSQRVELMGKLVDRLTGAVKQALQMQV